MNILSINGSPNKTGNTQNIVNAILKGAKKNDHSTDSFKDVSDYFDKWLGKFFFDMEKVTVIHKGNFTGESGECDKIERLEKYTKLGETLE
ncbi:MAG: hypothetical protein P9L97_07740 [Candidatus Tenebribacter davisii]|nr:hypothetical protein [Candidatus Tenebribacter davisii]